MVLNMWNFRLMHPDDGEGGGAPALSEGEGEGDGEEASEEVLSGDAPGTTYTARGRRDPRDRTGTVLNPVENEDGVWS